MNRLATHCNARVKKEGEKTRFPSAFLSRSICHREKNGGQGILLFCGARIAIGSDVTECPFPAISISCHPRESKRQVVRRQVPYASMRSGALHFLHYRSFGTHLNSSRLIILASRWARNLSARFCLQSSRLTCCSEQVPKRD